MSQNNVTKNRLLLYWLGIEKGYMKIMWNMLLKSNFFPKYAKNMINLGEKQKKEREC